MSDYDGDAISGNEWSGAEQQYWEEMQSEDNDYYEDREDDFYESD